MEFGSVEVTGNKEDAAVRGWEIVAFEGVLFERGEFSRRRIT
jgi:hypothetical protein